MDTVSSNKKPVALVALVEAGMGHIVSANAIADALEEKYADKVDVVSKRVLRDSDNELLPKFERFLIDNVKKYSKSPLFGYIQISAMRLIGSQNSLRLVHSTALRRQVNALVAEYAKAKPDAIISTHYFTTYCAVKYRNSLDRNVKVISYCPDNSVHGWWDSRCDVLYTNNPLATKQACSIKADNVKEVFYPTRKAVANASESKRFYRDRFGIPQDKFAVAVADGAYAEAKSKRICMQLLKTDARLTVCLLAGKNDNVKRQFDALKSNTSPNVTLLTFGYVDNAPELYRACDLLVTKGGPNAVLDSVCVGTPVIVDFCATPIEYATKKLFINRLGCGTYATSPRRVKKQIERYARNPELLRKYDDALKYFDTSKNGAADIADDVAKLLLKQNI